MPRCYMPWEVQHRKVLALPRPRPKWPLVIGPACLPAQPRKVATPGPFAPRPSWPFASCTPTLALQRQDRRDAAQPLWPGLLEEDLACLEAACTFANSSVIWQPPYGCSVLALPAGQPDTQPVPGTLVVAVVGLDEWVYDTHRCACWPGVTPPWQDL